MLNKVKKWLALLMSALMLLSYVSAFADTYVIIPGPNGNINLPINPNGPINVQPVQPAQPSHSHSWGDWQIVSKATCINSGKRARTCNSCGQKDTQSIEALGHKWGEPTTLRESTCTEPGKAEHTCSRCEITREYDLKLAEHRFGEWSVVVAATPFSKGIEERKCLNPDCDMTEQRDLYPEGTLKRGDRNDAVYELQQSLNDNGYKVGTPDGKFGPNTENWVKTVQKAMGMEQDGIAWPGLLALLNHEWSEWYTLTEPTDRSVGIEERKCLKTDCGKTEQRELYPEGTLMRGDRNDAVWALQENLNKNGYKVGTPDGKFGPNTEKWVKVVQKDLGMKQDGIAWPAVLAALSSESESMSVSASDKVVYTATVGASDVYYGKVKDSDTVTVKTDASMTVHTVYTAGAPEPDAPEFTVEKQVASTPANGMFYVPGETVRYVIGIKNRGPKLTDVVVEDVLADAPVATSPSVAAGANNVCYFNYTVTERDALIGSVTNVATITATDDKGNRLSASAAAVVPTGLAGFGVITEMTITKTETSTPANGSYYTEGETITYDIVIRNEGETDFGECIIYDSQAAGSISHVEHLYVTEARSFPHSYTVTAADAAAGCVYNTAWVEYVNGGGTETKVSNTVISDTDGAADTFAPAGIGTISTPVLPSGDGYVPCGHELLAKGDNGEEYGTRYCEQHVGTQEAVTKLTSMASTEDERLSAWTQARKLWQGEIDEMYVSLLNASDPIAKMNVMDDRIHFFMALGCHEALLNTLYPDDPAQVASMIAELLMNKSVSMCYELHTAANDRIDAFGHVSAFDFDLPCGEDCARNAVATGNGDARIAEQLCARHASVLQIRNRLLTENKNAEEAWTTVGQLWKNEVSTGYIGLYAELGESVLTASETFDNSVKAHEKVLDALYGRPEVVKEVLAQIMMDRAMELCGLK